MAGVESAKKALWALLRSLNAGRTAKLTVTTAKGKLKVILEESFTQHSNVLASTKSPKRASPKYPTLHDLKIYLILHALSSFGLPPLPPLSNLHPLANLSPLTAGM